MGRTWIVVDANYIAYRSHYAFPNLEWNGKPTGVVYGFLKEIQTLTQQHQSRDIVFAFDSPAKLRRNDFKGYKAGRKEPPAGLPEQVRDLRERILFRLGFQNVYCQYGYEADDVIAVLCNLLAGPRRMDNAVVVSSDRDLFQLLGARVSIWNPHQKVFYTEHSLMRDFGVEPAQWPFVKAIAGCSTDEIPGVDGIGEKKAALFVSGKNTNTKDALKIKAARDLWKRNLKLVRLPYPGCQVTKTPLPWDRTAVDLKVCKELMREFGFKSMMEFVPGA